MSDITWFGHSAFKISNHDVHVVIDPFLAPQYGLGVDDVGRADLVLLTHDHGDHVGEAVTICKKTGAMLGAIVGTAQKAAAGLPDSQILNGIGFNMGGTLACKGASITMTPAFHTTDSGCPAGYIVRMPDGLTVYHSGDTCVFGDMALWGQLYSIDVALLPIGGVFTMDASQAALACKLLNCKNVIPMHWGTFPVLAQDTRDFEKELAKLDLPCSCAVMAPGQTRAFSPGR
ncbi:metal-dependent hydrolase [Desulfovibrio sp.]|uniref:metal-dependent hydrolase n=1 Tax=Desulfovibrio sp. TaxID=885 RepID=UPI0025BCE98A|nr:metal-dependent hydrolase [Desulfovibrio sp.]